MYYKHINGEKGRTTTRTPLHLNLPFSAKYSIHSASRGRSFSASRELNEDGTIPFSLDPQQRVQVLQLLPKTAQGQLLMDTRALRHPKNSLRTLRGNHAKGKNGRRTAEGPLRLIPNHIEGAACA